MHRLADSPILIPAFLGVSALFSNTGIGIGTILVFSLTTISSCKGYSSSFSDILLVCVVSAASLQITVDRGRKQQENERFSVGVCVHTD